MLTRLIPENIEIVFIPGSDIGSINADKGQIEQVLMNLCLNARDAMPDGGRLVIETDHVLLDESSIVGSEWVKPGSYVSISVTDTGCGIDPSIMKNIFEPFFTTKSAHKGTGLGLSTVYGIVRQHQGMVRVYSELKKGACFKVYLPMTGTPVVNKIPQADKVISPGGAETILLAEDEVQIRTLAKQILEKAGYRVLEAADGEEALKKYQAHASEISLLFLDVIMPKQNGHAVYETIHALNPSIKCLFASGYSTEGLHKNFILQSGMNFLQKPYRINDLLKSVRRILDEKP